MCIKHLPLVALLVGSVLVVGCWSTTRSAPDLPRRDQTGQANMIDLTQARKVKARHDDELMNISGVVGTGLGRDGAGQHVIEVYVDRLSPELSRAIPAQLEGVPLRIVETGRFEAL